jgi:hypothetical protein
MLKISKDRYYIFFVISVVIFLMVTNSSYTLDFLYTYGFVFGLVSVILFAIYTYIYLIGAKDSKNRLRVLDIVFVLSVINFIAMFLFTGPLSNYEILYNANALIVMGLNTVLVIVVAFPLFLGAYLVRDKKFVRMGFVIFAIVMVLVIVYFTLGLIVKYYKLDDEVFIGIKEIHYFFMGLNPYQNSIAQQVYNNRTAVGFTQTTGNQLVGVLSYPALYMFSFIPFYFAFPSTIHGIEYYILPIQAAVFFVVLLFVIAFSIDKEHLKSPIFGLAIVLALAFSLTASSVDCLILALLILAYKYTGTKYSWIFFGLCISIQQLLWVPIILLVAYSVNNYGFKKGALDILGAASVFLLINGYFIARGPMAFFSAIFGTIKNMMPIGTSAIGFALLTKYHVLLSTYTIIFGIVLLIVTLLYIYVNDKRLVGLLCIVPFMFLSRSIISYYTIFIAFIFVALLIKESKTNKGLIGSYIGMIKPVFVSAVVLLSLLLVVVIYASHLSYVKAFDLNVSNQSLYYNPVSKETIYTGRLSYSNLSNSSVYIMFFGFTNDQVQIIGIFNHSIINNSLECNSNDIQCLVNVNRIVLNKSNDTYNIRAHFTDGNQSENITDVRLLVYYGKYFYASDSVSDTVK